jgi:putative ABC transport system permease protein
MFESLLSDIRFSLRSLARHPVYAVTSIATLALGIGANALVYAVASAVFVQPLPFARGDELVKVTVTHRVASGKVAEFAVSPIDFTTFVQRNRTLSGIGAILTQSYSVATGAPGDVPRTLLGGGVSASMWHVLGVEPIAGRAYTDAEDQPGASLVMIGEELQRRLFPGAPSNAVGHTLSIDGAPRVVVGVMPAGVTPGLFPGDVWLPLGINASTVTPAPNRTIQLIGRLKPRVTIDQARVDIERIARELETELPTTHKEYGGTAVSLRSKIADGVESLALTLLASVGFLLVLAIANVANLALARVSRRRTEISTRIALGGPRSSIVRQQLCESILIGVGGGVFGVIAAAVILPSLMRMTSGGSALLNLVAVDWRVLSMVMLVSIVAGALCGIAPALYGIRMALSSPLAGGGRRQQGGIGENRMRQLLMSGQVAAAAVLLVGAFGMFTTLRRLSTADVGFHSEQVVVANVTLPTDRYGKTPERSRFVDAVLERMRATPGIRSAGISSNRFVLGEILQTMIVIDGIATANDDRHATELRRTTEGYFGALGIPILRGRDFSPADRDTALQVAIVNRSFVRQYLNGGEAVGKRIRRGPPTNPWITIIGVVPDVMDRGVGVDIGPMMYVSFRQSSASEFSFVASTTMNVAAFARAVHDAVAPVDATLAVDGVTPLPRLLADSLNQGRFKTLVIALLAGLALVLASTGIYGVTAFLIGERTREIAIRLALGARVSRVIRGLVIGATRWTVAAAIIGLVLAKTLGGVARRYVPELSETTTIIYAGTAVLLIFVGVIATLIPTWRASRLSPSQVLRGE